MQSLIFPSTLENSISELLRNQGDLEWIKRAKILHERYTAREKINNKYITDFNDALAYLALRTPATYSQIHGALTDIKEVIPTFAPQSILDIGSGPGTGVWAAKEIFPSLKDAVCIDSDNNLIAIGEKITQESNLSINIEWKRSNIAYGIEKTDKKYDIVLLSNVLNELSITEQEKILGSVFNQTKGLVVIVEPGTPLGHQIVTESAKKFVHTSKLIAPFVGDIIPQTNDYYIHFVQRFKRPEFERRVRQHLRDSSLMASDWEDAKYCYAAFGKIGKEVFPWGRCIGPTKIQKGFLEIPVLTDTSLEIIKVMKRYKKEYTYAKNSNWGDLIMEKENICISNPQKKS